MNASITRAEYERFRGLFRKGRNAVLAIKPGGQGDVTASHVAWTNTRQARLLDPVCRSVYQGLNDVAAHLGIADLRRENEFRQVMRRITTAYVSDARWPPQLKTPPPPGELGPPVQPCAFSRVIAL